MPKHLQKHLTKHLNKRQYQPWLLKLSVGVLVGLIPAAALACSCLGPAPLGLLGKDGTLPANSWGVLWDNQSRSQDNPQTLAPVKIIGPGGKPLKLESKPISPEAGVKLVLLRPAGGFKPGQQYRFEGVSGRQEAQRITVSRSATALTKAHTALELKVGALKREAITVLTRYGSCSTTVSTNVVPIELNLPAAALPFKDQLYYRTVVDGQPWKPLRSLCSQPVPGVSWLGERGRDQLFSACASGAEEGLKPGVHSVEMVASLLGTDILFKSKKVKVELKCPTAQS